MSFIIATRVNGNGAVQFVHEDRHEDTHTVLEFSSHLDAQAVAEKIPSCKAWGFQILEVECG